MLLHSCMSRNNVHHYMSRTICRLTTYVRSGIRHRDCIRTVSWSLRQPSSWSAWHLSWWYGRSDKALELCLCCSIPGVERKKKKLNTSFGWDVLCNAWYCLMHIKENSLTIELYILTRVLTCSSFWSHPGRRHVWCIAWLQNDFNFKRKHIAAKHIAAHLRATNTVS